MLSDSIYFVNEIAYIVTNPVGDIVQSGATKNAAGARLKNQIMRALTVQEGVSAGTLSGIQDVGFRADGSTILGSTAQYVFSTAFSTRYNNSTYVTSVNFNSTFSATANVTVKTVILFDEMVELNPASSDVGSFMSFYSTSLNLSVGSAGKIIVSWTINHN
jgi:hypothetical protein